MKKLFLSLAVLGLFAFATSCKKECTCTTYQDDTEVSSTTVESKACSDLDEEYTQGGMNVRVVCE